MWADYQPTLRKCSTGEELIGTARMEALTASRVKAQDLGHKESRYQSQGLGVPSLQ